MPQHSVSPIWRSLGRYARDAFGGTGFSVVGYTDGGPGSSIDVVMCRNSPTQHVISYSTVGLSDKQIFATDLSLPLRAELVGAADDRFAEFPKILSTAAFCVINTGWSCRPGAVFPGVVEAHHRSSDMKHLVLMAQFLWDGLELIELEDRQVDWLLVVPVSEAEARFCREFGIDALETRFDAEQIDVFDLDRRSVL
jgi:antitoxin YqcF